MLYYNNKIIKTRLYSTSGPHGRAAAARRAKSHLAGPTSSPAADRAHTNDDPETATPRAPAAGREENTRGTSAHRAHTPRAAGSVRHRRRRGGGGEAEPNPATATHFPVAICIALPSGPDPAAPYPKPLAAAGEIVLPIPTPHSLPRGNARPTRFSLQQPRASAAPSFGFALGLVVCWLIDLVLDPRRSRPWDGAVIREWRGAAGAGAGGEGISWCSAWTG